MTELSGNFGWISGKSGKIKIFPENFFLLINFRLALLSIMHFFMFWNIFLLFLAMSITDIPQITCKIFSKYDSVPVTCLMRAFFGNLALKQIQQYETEDYLKAISHLNTKAFAGTSSTLFALQSFPHFSPQCTSAWYYVGDWIFVFKDMSTQVQFALLLYKGS